MKSINQPLKKPRGHPKKEEVEKPKRGRPKKDNTLINIQSIPKKRGRPKKDASIQPISQIKRERSKKEEQTNKKIDSLVITGTYEIWNMNSDWCKIYVEDRSFLDLICSSLNLSPENEYFDGKHIRPIAWDLSFKRSDLAKVQKICKKLKFEKNKECKKKLNLNSKK